MFVCKKSSEKDTFQEKIEIVSVKLSNLFMVYRYLVDVL